MQQFYKKFLKQFIIIFKSVQNWTFLNKRKLGQISAYLSSKYL